MDELIEELLKYFHTTYYETPKQYTDLEKYMKKKFFHKEPERAEMIHASVVVVRNIKSAA